MKRRPISSVIVSAAVIVLLAALPLQAGAGRLPSQSPSAGAAAAPQALAQPAIPGVRNYTRVDATFACGGALSGNAVETLKQAGFKSIVNLRAADEPGADVEAEARAAKEAGLKYVWLPFVTASPDPGKVDEFLAAVVDPANQPMLIHCTSGGRVSMFWAIKRVMVDGWPVEKAMGELPELSKNVSPALRNFTLDYLKQHGKKPNDAR